MVVSVRLSEKENKLIKDFAKLNNISVSELMRTAVLERIENEIDLRAYEKAKKEYEANPISYSHEEVVKMLELDD